MSVKRPLLVDMDNNDDTFYVGPLGPGMAAAYKERSVKVTQHASRQWHVTLHDSPNLVSATEAEWGNGSTLEEAWRYALGAFFGPLDEEYNEDFLVRIIEENS